VWLASHRPPSHWPPRWLSVGVTAIAVGACGAAPDEHPVDPLPECVAGHTLPEFARAPGGALEVDAVWLAEHRCQVRIVDVREAAELTGELGRIAGSEWIPLNELAANAERWSSDEPIVIVDRSGRRAVRAEESLRALGLRRVASLTGGMIAWHHAGFPVASRSQLSTAGLPPSDPASVPVPSEPVPSTPAPSPPDLSDPVRDHLSDASNIAWVNVAAIVGSGTEECIDGRGDGPVVGTPGGDAGEIILTLSAFEHASRTTVPDEVVGPTLAAYVAGFGRFYLHTDEAALARLATSLTEDPRFVDARESGALSPDGIEAFLRHPPRELEDPLLEALVASPHVGCGHLRLMMEHPSEYGVRRELVEAVLREAFRLGWSRPELLDFAVLEGEHHEEAVVRVWLDQPIHAYTRVPTFPATEPGTRFFVAHPEVSAFLRSELGSFLEEHALGLGLSPTPRAAFEHELTALAERQVNATLRHLARELPVYDVHVHEGSPTVSGPNPSLGCRDY
jgi:rhodanese-related sulfurtransferase